MPRSTAPLDICNVPTKESALFAFVVMGLKEPPNVMVLYYPQVQMLISVQVDWDMAAKRLGYNNGKTAKSAYGSYKSRLSCGESSIPPTSESPEKGGISKPATQKQGAKRGRPSKKDKKESATPESEDESKGQVKKQKVKQEDEDEEKVEGEEEDEKDGEDELSQV